MDTVICDLNIALAWGVSAENASKNVHGFSPDQLVFGRNPNFPNVFHNELPALEGRTVSEIVASNLNAMHAARQQCIKSECLENIARASRHQTRTYRNTSYSTGDLVYYKRDQFKTWKGPATVIGQNG